MLFFQCPVKDPPAGPKMYELSIADSSEENIKYYYLKSYEYKNVHPVNLFCIQFSPIWFTLSGPDRLQLAVPIYT